MPKFVPLAVVSFVVFLLLAVVLAAFLVDGHGWSRLVLTLMAVFGVLVAALGLLNHLPVLLEVLSAVSMVLYAALVFFLWRQDTSAYLRVH